MHFSWILIDSKYTFFVKTPKQIAADCRLYVLSPRLSGVKGALALALALALIAVANKLYKQSLAIAKSGLLYDENFKGVYLNVE